MSNKTADLHKFASRSGCQDKCKSNTHRKQAEKAISEATILEKKLYKSSRKLKNAK